MHPQPQPDELLSSWMMRLAHANGFKVHSFFARHFGAHRQVWTRDIDHAAPGWLLEGLSQRTGVPVERIEQMTLRAYESYAFERFNPSGATSWVLPVATFHRTRRRFGQQFCALCLRSDAQPYLRRRWRLAMITVCTEHAVELQDRCSHCAHPLMPHRADMASRRACPRQGGMDRCGACGARLESVTVAAPPADLEAARVFEQALANGYARVGTNSIYAHLYFAGLRMLVSGLQRARRASSERGRFVFELAAIERRRELLQAAFGLLQQWPARLLEFCANVRRPYTLFMRGESTAPHWLADVLRRHCYMAFAPLSLDEAHAILAAVDRAKSGKVQAEARRVSGRDLSRVLPAIERVPDDVAARLFGWLGRRIETESHPLRRALWLRDRAMLSLGRSHGLGEEQLARLCMDANGKRAWQVDGEADAPDIDLHADSHVAAYLLGARERLLRSSAATALFVSASAGRRLSRSSIGMRLEHVVRAATLRQQIPSWMHWVRPRSESPEGFTPRTTLMPSS